MDEGIVNLRDRWLMLCGELAVPADLAASVGDTLLAAHLERHRRYHDLTHLAECFAIVDVMTDLTARQRSEAELAIWFHDVVYDATAMDNEQRSAAVAADFLERAGRPELCPTVVRAIEMTAGHEPAGDDPVLIAVHDADLGILGAEPARYEEYASAIRQEYSHVDDDAFRSGRSTVLRSFLAAATLYLRPELAASGNDRARQNMIRELARLEPG